MTDAATAPSAPASLPMFYKRPMPLEPLRHATAGLKPEQSYRFAADTNALPLMSTEMAHAARVYPIVFSATTPTVPFAVVGLRDHENLFVDGAGAWREDCYIPAYVRRYPFIFSEVPETQRLVLCIDEAADNYQTTSGEPLFTDGKPTDALQRVLQFNETFQQHYLDTRRFGEWLDQNNMLEDRVANADLGGGQTFTLRGFRLLNPDRLRALEDAQVVELHKRGWLPLLHFHLQSLQNWQLLGTLTRGRGASKPS